MRILMLLIAGLCYNGLNSTNFKTQIHQNIVDEPNRKKIAEAIVSDLAKENYEQVRKEFHAQLKANLSVEKISEAWAKFTETMGSFEKIVSTSPTTARGYTQIKCRCAFKEGNATVEVTFDEDDRVIALFLR
ncbi:MAG: DUF3887 domain-containing protein [Pedobacter sp.]|nr:MAG: DUF3887 domain-containing protein [Pedobacter sp.]